MEIIQISNWCNSKVLDWFDGLDDSLHRYREHLRLSDLVGEQLLLLNAESLHKLQIHLIGHQELILDAVSLLQQLEKGLVSDTLQSRAICLNCRCRSFRAAINTRRREDDVSNEDDVTLKPGATNQLLKLASSVLEEGKQVILWLERSPFNGKSDFREIRTRLVKLCYELSVTMQQSVFACVIEDASLAICCDIENTAEGIIQSCDPLVVQPVTLERVCFHDIDPSRGIGIFIKVTFEGHHVVTGTRHNSVAAKSRKITSGDELIAVNGTTVIGWTLPALVSALKAKHDQVTLLLRKRPQMSTSSSSYNFMLKLREQEQQNSYEMMTVGRPRRAVAPSSGMNGHHAVSLLRPQPQHHCHLGNG